MRLSMFKRAFTLAEVLITLGIIGIVAAMTMPALMQDYKYKEFDARFKVAQNVLNNAQHKMVQMTMKNVWNMVQVKYSRHFSVKLLPLYMEQKNTIRNIITSIKIFPEQPNFMLCI